MSARHTHNVAASDVLGMMLPGAVPPGGIARPEDDDTGQPYHRRSERCIVCHGITAYAVTWQHWHDGTYKSCGPYCTFCSSEHHTFTEG